MQKQNLKLIRDILFRIFVIGVLFAIFFFVMTASFWDFWTSMIYSKFQVSEKEFGGKVVDFFLYLRFYLVFIILVPAIALHWIIKTQD